MPDGPDEDGPEDLNDGLFTALTDNAGDVSTTWPGIALAGARELEPILPEGLRQVQVVTEATPMRDVVGSGGRIRTYDQAVNSRPLYH